MRLCWENFKVYLTAALSQRQVDQSDQGVKQTASTGRAEFSAPPVALQSSSSGSSGQNWAGSQCTGEAPVSQSGVWKEGFKLDNWAISDYSFGLQDLHIPFYTNLNFPQP